MKRPQALAKSKYLKDMDDRRIMSRAKQMEAHPTHNLPDNLEKAYKLLQKAVGEKWVSADDAITAGYSCDQSARPANYPDIVVLPASTEEVAEVFKIANECLVDVMPYGTGCNTGGMCIPPFGGIILDGRRMDKILALDEKNFYATVEVGVNYCQLQAEAQKRGMRVANPSAPATVSVLTNHLFCNINSMAGKYGFGMDNVLGVEVVLPTGEIVEFGPEAYGMDQAQVPGFGPDMSSLLRYAWGTMGYATKMTIRLYPEPTFNKNLYPAYPDDDLKDLIEALYRLAQDNQAIELAQLQNTFYSIFMGLDNKETEGFMSQIPRNNIIALFGGTTEKEVDIKLKYAQEQVQSVSPKYFFLNPDDMKVMTEGRLNLLKWSKFFKETVRVQRVRGSFIIGALVYNLDSFYEIEKAMRIAVTDELGTTKDIFRPDDASAYLQPYHMGRMCYLEFDLYTNQDDKNDLLKARAAYTAALGVGFMNGAIFAGGTAPFMIGNPHMAMLIKPELQQLINLCISSKVELDPKNICYRRWDYDTGIFKKFLSSGGL